MSRDVLTVGSTMRILLLYRREYSQWVERFMNYLEEQTDGEAMINSIKNGDQPLPRVSQVSIAGTTSTEQPPLKDKSMWSDQEKRVQKIDHLARSLLIQGLLNDIYSLIDSNKTAKDLWDAFVRHMLGYEYVINDLKKCGYSKDNCELNFKFLNNLQPEWKQYATMMRPNKNLMNINIDGLYNILKQNQGDVNDAMGSKKKTVVVTSDPFALIAEKTNVSRKNYVPWSSCLLRYAKSRPNGKLIHNSIINGPYVRRMIPEPGDTNRDVPVNETFHVQTDDELTEKELKHIEADNQAIQTILLVLPKDIYAAVDSCETAQEIWLRVQQIMKGSDIGIQEKKATLFNEWERFTSNEGESIESYYHPPHQDQPSFNQNYMQQPIPNPDDITDPTTAMNMALTLMAKAFKLNYSTPTNNNQRILSNPRNRQISQPSMNIGQDRQMQMVGGDGGNQFRQYAGQNARNLTGYNDVQNIGNQNLVGNGNLVATRAEGNAAGHNENQIRCYNCRGVEEQYTELLEPILEPHQVPPNDNNVISKVTSVEQSGETVDQRPANFDETRALYDSLYQNLAIEVEKVNSVNRKLKETNADLTIELARFKNQEK
nr:hypothetical protein [Tanacetum cinerariifolium]